MIIKLSKKIIAIVLIVLLCMMYPLTVTPVLGAGTTLTFDENATLVESAKSFYTYYKNCLFGKVDYEKKDILEAWLDTYMGKYTVEDLKKTIDKQLEGEYNGNDRRSIDRFLDDNYLNDPEKQLEYARKRIGDFAERFANNKSNETEYDYTYGPQRKDTYNNKPPTGSGPFIFDCVGFVDYVIHYSIGLTNEKAENGWGGFVSPQSLIKDNRFSSIDVSQAQRGDVLIDPEDFEGDTLVHVAIYLGDNKVSDSTTLTPTVEIRDINKVSNGFFEPKTHNTFTMAARLNSLDGVNYGELPGGVQFTGPITDLDSLDFEFSGMPVTATFAGGYSLMYYISKIGDLFDYIFGIMFNGIKIVPVRIINGMYEIITNTFDYLNGNTSET